MYLLMYYFIFHRLNKYLLNKINYTEFEFKQKFYSNKYLLQFLYSTNFKLSPYTTSITIQFLITSQFHIHIAPHYISLIHSTRTDLQLHSNVNSASEQSAEIYIDAVKLKIKYFCSIKQNVDFENNICLSYLGCSSSFNFEFIIHEQLVTYIVYYCICHKAVHTDIYT